MEKDIYRQFYEFEKDHWWSRGMRYLCLEMIGKYCPGAKGGRILDMGCGTGELTRALAVFGDVTGADYSNEAIVFCGKRGIHSLVRTFAEKSPFKENTFSLVVAFCLIEHIDQDASFVEEMRRVLKKGGYLVVLTSAFNFLWSYHDEVAHHKRRYTVGRIRKLFSQKGLSVKKATYVNFLLFPAVLLIRMLQRIFRAHPRLEEGFLLDIVKLPRFLNEAMYNILRSESKILKWADLPLGVGILCIGKKD